MPKNARKSLFLVVTGLWLALPALAQLPQRNLTVELRQIDEAAAYTVSTQATSAPLVAQQVQVDTYLVCGLVSDTLNHMVDTFVRDYLVERIEGMLEHRVITGYYPRLALAPGQRFASKGGYLVRFVGAAGTRVAPEGDWTVP